MKTYSTTGHALIFKKDEVIYCRNGHAVAKFLDDYYGARSYAALLKFPYKTKRPGYGGKMVCGERGCKALWYNTRRAVDKNTVMAVTFIQFRDKDGKWRPEPNIAGDH